MSKTKRAKPLLGIPEMDAQHDYLYTLFNRLLEEPTKAGMARLLEEMAGYLDFHITSEEHLIRLYKAPGFSEHQSAHELAARTLLGYMDDFDRGTLNPARLHKAMTGWLYEHTVETDREYADFIKPLRDAAEKPHQQSFRN